MHCHDPTSYHQQSDDKGSQYRSVLFYQTEQELKNIKSVIKEIDCDETYMGFP